MLFILSFFGVFLCLKRKWFYEQIGSVPAVMKGDGHYALGSSSMVKEQKMKQCSGSQGVLMDLYFTDRGGFLCEGYL